ncbi:MAG: glycosyltransferase family 2 protein [Bacteroidales bacterium]|jgi:glycosyltransferase involved in cell wall biosynthesis|nr:glycosyltransferase family 2 protein [Bacteroidales bacterium]
MQQLPALYVAIPATDELDYLPKTLQAIENQKYNHIVHFFVCVNQPEEWWQIPEKREICEHNQKLLAWLQNYKNLTINVIDCSSPQKGWSKKNYGVGWARKILFDAILHIANNQDIIISLDADTLIEPNYFASIGDNFSQRQNKAAIAVPYYHRLTGEESADRAILRYEIYMRNWLLNMFCIGSPYAFTAIGSAMALRVNNLRIIRGITPLKSGEDFYLLQKLRKMSPISNYNRELVYPAARFSDRVEFGTGPAMIKGATGHWESYPIYHHSLFREIGEAYQLIPQLFKYDIAHPFFNFVQERSGKPNLWQLLRNNFREASKFERAFHANADGLRILQYMKERHNKTQNNDLQSLAENIQWYHAIKPPYLRSPAITQLAALSIAQLATIREALFVREQQLRNEEIEKIEPVK